MLIVKIKKITLKNIISSRIFFKVKEAKAVVDLEDTCLKKIWFGKRNKQPHKILAAWMPISCCTLKYCSWSPKQNNEITFRYFDKKYTFLFALLF